MREKGFAHPPLALQTQTFSNSTIRNAPEADAHCGGLSRHLVQHHPMETCTFLQVSLWVEVQRGSRMTSVIMTVGLIS